MKLIFSKKSGAKGLFFYLIKIVFLFILAILSFSLILFFYFIKDFPKPEKFTEKPFIQSTKIYDQTGEVLLYDLFGEEKRTVIPLEEIPLSLRQAVIITEDANFYNHNGVDFGAVFQVVIQSIKKGEITRGASTISQQLIRSSFLTTEKTAERKVRELVLTIELERRYSKDDILEFYLNQIPLGGNLYGVETASYAFFHKKPLELTTAESAIIASVIQAPTYYSPYGLNKRYLLERKDWILERLYLYGFINQEVFEESKKEEIKFYPPTTPMKAPHFIMYIINDYLIPKYGEDYLRKNGLRVYTSIDWRLQELAEKSISQNSKINKEFGAYNAAIISIDPKNGRILSMVGSKNYFGESFPDGCISGVSCSFEPQDNVVLRKRQPGSAFKPFVYATALEKGYTIDTVIFDVLTNFGVWGSKSYIPKNYDGKFRGPITLRKSLAQSLNIPSVKTLYLAGVQNSIDTAKKMGISTLNQPSSFYGLSLVLGGGEVKLLDITSAYGVFSQNGLKAPITPIIRIEDSSGNILEERQSPTLKRVLSSQIAQTINDVLSDNNARAPMFGLNSYLNFTNFDTAAKTGTTQNYKDAWTIGYSNNLVTGVWVGNNNNSPMAPRPAVLTAGPIWHSFMEGAFKYYIPEKFEKPREVITTIPALNGVIQRPFHSILYYTNKNNPRAGKPINPSSDPQYILWESAINNFYK